jgi:putative transposase
MAKAKKKVESIDEKGMLNQQEQLSKKMQRRMEVLQRLKSYKGKAEYREEKNRAAKELGVSDRSLRRMILRYREEGIEGIIRKERSDRGETKVSEEWKEFIEKSYRRGNRGMRRTTVAQVAKLVEVRAQEKREERYPSEATVYRLLKGEIERRERKRKSRAIGWYGEELKIRTKEGIELSIEHSNQVWQCDHTAADILVVDKEGGTLGRPSLTTIVDTYSRCIVGVYIGMEMPSAEGTCLALRQAILPKRYGLNYELRKEWPNYGLPEYLYTDAGKDFTSKHIEQVAGSLGITLCLRKKPSDGGIVERPFGTMNSEFFSTLPGYTTSRLRGHRKKVKEEACVTLEDLERMLVRYIVDNYNQRPDARTRKQSRVARWQGGLLEEPIVMDESELDILLMRKDRRSVYRGGYIRYANLVYKGEGLEKHLGEMVVLRCNPRDISKLLIYREEGDRDVYLTTAYAQYIESASLSLAEARAMSRREREAAKEVFNPSVLEEIGDRDQFVENLLND